MKPRHLQSAKSESSTYGVSKTVKHLVENPGRVRRLTAAIVVNDRMLQPATKKSPAVWQPRSADELRNLTALAQAAVGFDTTRGDVLTVQDIAFEDNRGSEPVPLPEKLRDDAENSPLLLKYAAFLVAILVVMGFGVRPALRHAASAPSPRAAKPKELAAGAAAPALPAEAAEPDPERARNQEIFEQVTQQLKREPTQSSRLLQSWIHSE